MKVLIYIFFLTYFLKPIDVLGNLLFNNTLNNLQLKDFEVNIEDMLFPDGIKFMGVFYKSKLKISRNRPSLYFNQLDNIAEDSKNFPIEFEDPAAILAFRVFGGSSMIKEKGEKFYSFTILNNDELQIFAKIVKASFRFPDFENFNDMWLPKIAVIATWENIYPKGKSEDTMNNTLQLVLLSNGPSTYVILNYKDINWYKNGEDSAFVGFNAGNNLGFYSIMSNENVLSLSKIYGSAMLGRYIYRVDSFDIQRGGCLYKPENVDKSVVLPNNLQISAKFDSIFGGKLLHVSGPCLMSSVISENTDFNCQFTRLNEAQPTSSTSKAYRTSPPLSDFYLKCVTPRFFKTGMYELKLVSNTSVPKYTTEFSVVNPAEENTTDITLLTNGNNWNWDLLKPLSDLSFSWNPKLVSSRDGRIKISILGYSESSNNPTELNELYSSDENNDGFHAFKPEIKCDKKNALCGTNHIGVIQISTLVEPVVSLYSPMMAVGWFVNEYMTEKLGSSWPDAMCKDNNILNVLKNPPKWQNEITCPCNKDQASADKVNFMHTNYCPRLPKNDCSKGVPTQTCFTQIIPVSPDLSSSPVIASLCCYDSNTGNLLYSAGMDFKKKVSDTKPHGSYACRVSPYGSLSTTGEKSIMTAPYVSNWFWDVRMFYYCCIWNSKPDSCPFYSAQIVPNSSCKNYNGIKGHNAIAVGDPHFVTFGNEHYSFNGIGDFWLLHTKDAFLIQGRLENTPAKKWSETGEEFSGSRLVSVIVQIKDASDRYEIKFRKTSEEREKFFLMVLQNGNTLNFEKNYWFTKTISGKLVYLNIDVQTDYNKPWKSITIIMVKDNDKLVLTIEGMDILSINSAYLITKVGISSTLKYRTSGLFGEWNDLLSSFLSPNNFRFVGNKNNDSDLIIYGESCRVKSEQESLFTYSEGLGFNHYNGNKAKSFEPTTKSKVLNLIGSSEAMRVDLNKACDGENRDYKEQCMYDIVVTGDKLMGSSTLYQLRSFAKDFQRQNISYISCGFPNSIGIAMPKTENFLLGSKIILTECLGGIKPSVDKQELICQADSNWNPAPIPDFCAFDGVIETAGVNVGLFIGLVILIIVLIAIIIGSVIFVRRRKQNSQNKESTNSTNNSIANSTANIINKSGTDKNDKRKEYQSPKIPPNDTVYYRTNELNQSDENRDKDRDEANENRSRKEISQEISV